MTTTASPASAPTTFSAEPAMPGTESPRLRSLDVFRGATVAFMILVNDAGDWGTTFAPLLHAEWHGWTPTDLVFPFFLFIVGVAIPFALGSRVAEPRASRGALDRRILRRGATLFLLGVALIWFPFYTVHWERVRILGVLQRIGLVYTFAALAFVHLSRRARAALALAILAGYWAAMRLVPVPGFGAGDLSAQGNLAFHVDHLVLGRHIWYYSPGPGDPEGLLSTLPAIVTALLGVFVGEFFRARRGAARPGEYRRAFVALAGGGSLLAAAGLALAPLFPINKNLWSPTYVLFTGGAAAVALALTGLVVDVAAKPTILALARPFEAFGRNAIVAYVGSGVLARILGLVKVAGADGVSVSLQKWLYVRGFASWLPPYWASLGWALAIVLLFLALVGLLDRRGLHFRV